MRFPVIPPFAVIRPETVNPVEFGIDTPDAPTVIRLLPLYWILADAPAGAHINVYPVPLSCRNPLLPFVALFCPDAPNHANAGPLPHVPRLAFPNVGELVVSNA